MTEVTAPLVSCIMPTRDRRAFVPRAVAWFHRQTYVPRELIVVDDGNDPIDSLLPEDERIRYVRLPQQASVGTKRNVACEHARGELIAHWDDDDWHAPHRLSYQVDALMAAQAEVCGVRRLLFHEPASGRTWLYDYPAHQRPWLIGGTLLYTREFWRRAPFADLQVGEDARFLWSQPRAGMAVPAEHTFYVATIHAGNTARKDTRGAYWSEWHGDLRSIVGADLDPPFGGPTGGACMQLNLGCCDALLPDFVNVDVVDAPGVTVADLKQPWPWPDESVAHVRAWDIVEHLPDKIFTMNELWRVLAPDGTAEIAVPTTDGSGAFQDPTHVSFWNRRSFLYYEAGNPYRERFATSYGIRARFRTLRERTDASVDGPRLTITLQALKP
jgi:glycosyltransferase involved in cell wall biosynthesis